jgi:hypothetical protein
MLSGMIKLTSGLYSSEDKDHSRSEWRSDDATLRHAQLLELVPGTLTSRQI